MTQRGWKRAVWTVGTALFLVFVFSLTLGFWDKAESHESWIKHGGFMVPVTAPAYTGPQGCCGERDCSMIRPEDVEVRGAGFFIKSLGETVPMSEVNWNTPDGQYWRCQNNANNKRKCFFAPQPGV